MSVLLTRMFHRVWKKSQTDCVTLAERWPMSVLFTAPAGAA
jgi:hypothetical protein